MEQLSEQNLHKLSDKVTRYQYDRLNIGIGIVHIGLGAFHRAHQAIYTENVMNKFGGCWGICGVSLRNDHAQRKLSKQDNLYTLAIADNTSSYQVVGALKECLFAKEQQQAVLLRLSVPATKLVSLTITEKGYCLLPDGKLDLQHVDIVHDLQAPSTPISAIGYLVEGLRLRKENNIEALNILSCDNMTANGDKLKSAVITFAHELDHELAAWIKNNVAFPNSMVDSITPKTETHLIESVANAIGLRDEWPIQRETFSQWIIADDWQGVRPQWEAVGAIFTSNVHGFETAKLRLLNGVHSTLAYIGTLAGFKTVHQAMNNEIIQRFVHKLVYDEIVTSFVPPKELDITCYVEAIIQRFMNPSIEHLLAQIAWDGSQKIPVRILPIIADNLANHRSTLLSCFVVASWFEFVCQSLRLDVDIVDPIGESFKQNVELRSDDCTTVVWAFLKMKNIFSEAIKENDIIAEQLIKSLSLIRSGAIKGTEMICLKLE